MTPAFDRPIAHRGLHNRAHGVIENSASAFEAAIAAGYHIECDLQLSRDGIPIVFHDDDLKRLTGRTGTPGDLTAAEFAETPLLESVGGDRPQRFTELLAQVAGRTLLQVELKHQRTRETTDTLAARAAEAIAGYRGPLVVESFDPNLLTAVRRHGYRGRLGIISYRYDQPDWEGDMKASDKFVLRHMLHYPWTRFDFMSLHEAALTLPAARVFKALGKDVTCWTIRSADAARSALAGGADQIVFEGFDANAL
jgi:glycerophosphoryl diester phosphodiesterase